MFLGDMPGHPSMNCVDDRGWHDSGDNPVDENGEAICEDCGAPVNAVPDCGDPGPDCVEHNGACD